MEIELVGGVSFSSFKDFQVIIYDKLPYLKSQLIMALIVCTKYLSLGILNRVFLN